MDVKYINPFLAGTEEVLYKMASIRVSAGKPYLKKSDIAPGDVSGIIGITGDAIGSLAISFSEACICDIVSCMLGEIHKEVNRDVIDAAGELTNMVSGAARSRLEKQGLALYAAIPTVVFGKGHTVRHILDDPGIIIPFATDRGSFYVDICLRAAADMSRAIKSPPVALQKETGRQPLPPKPEVRPVTEESKPRTFNTPEEKIAYLKEVMEKTIALRNDAIKILEKNPFINIRERKKHQQAIEFYDAKIKRLKMDIAAVDILSGVDLNNEIKIKKHYQHYDNSKKKI
ncbi:MAG: chemotaxis protein CheX [Syntrophales bacterium]